ncbi:uncharacterized protein LOC134245573 [Saccostrea cucullata]|uniref:uncharacterized protein LOC134231041 n=1 Tax=Saccostrea cuccullata TaxID=36930 RepID=UPI002ED22D37
MSQNKELTAGTIRNRLRELFHVSVSLSTVNKARREMGWSSNTGKYCQQISHANKRARMQWSCQMFRRQEDFHDVIFADESSVEMNAHGKLFFHHCTAGMQMSTRKRSRPKHAYKVHVWAGISYRGRTPICIFTGIMNSSLYQRILSAKSGR